MRKLVWCLAFAGLLAVGSTASAGPLVYNNGLPNQANGNEMTQWIQAEDFTLTTATTLGDARFWSVSPAGAYQGSIVWQIYANAGGQPGALLHSGTANPTRTFTGNNLFFGQEFQNDFALPNISLAAGTYWLGLHNGPLTTTNRLEFYWETTNVGGGNTGTARGREDVAPFGAGGWFNNGQEHAFQLFATNVPEPMSMVVFGGLAVAGLAGVRRRLKKA